MYVHYVNYSVIVGNTAKIIVKFHNGRRYPILYGSAQIHVIFFVFKHGFISLFGDFVTITFVQVPYCVLNISKRGPTFYAMYRKIQFLEGFIDEWKMLGHQVFFKVIFVSKFWRVLFTNATWFWVFGNATTRCYLQRHVFFNWVYKTFASKNS